MARKIDRIEHPEIIKEILDAAPPNTKLFLTKYMDALVEAIMEARGVAEEMLEQRNRIIGFVDEMVDSLGDIFADDSKKEEAKNAASELFERMKSTAKADPKKPEA